MEGAMHCRISTLRAYARAALFFFLVASPAGNSAAQSHPPSDYVNTLRGSDSRPDYSHGNTFPAVALPFGFNFWTPVTSEEASGWIYDYRSPTLTGFAVSHEPSPWIGDYASLRVSPGVHQVQLAAKDRAANFRHEDELARAHRYKVRLRSGIETELSPSEHGAVFRFKYPADPRPHLVFDRFNSRSCVIAIDPSTRSIEGHVDSRGPRMYFSARFDQPFAPAEAANDRSTVALMFPARTTAVVMKIATSFISVEQAKLNLEHELASKSLAEVQSEAQARWDALLGRVEVEGASDDRATTLYSNLYRAFLYPNTMTESDASGEHHFSPYVGAVRDGVLYVNNGFWDTYRAAWPLYTLLIPSQSGRMLSGFLSAYSEGGWTPRWSGPGYIDMMVGTHTDIVFADAYMKGVRNFDARLAYESMLKNALVDSGDKSVGRHGNRWGVFR
ncbi:MAG TPA: GH92 family glycosyl hydrolase, partial [Polyangiales bacterium]|nr:GH92 family glycosyl hydrolase [Polyangiales bacterium]